MLYGLEVDYVINYTRDPDWGSTARKLSPDGQGVDHIIEIGGAGTLHQSIKAVKFEGLISVIGAVANSDPSASVPSILDCWLHQCVVRGVGVGSRAMMEEMVDAVENNDIHPVLDEKTFSLKQAKEALKHFVSCISYRLYKFGPDYSSCFRPMEQTLERLSLTLIECQVGAIAVLHGSILRPWIRLNTSGPILWWRQLSLMVKSDLQTRSSPSHP